MWEKNWKINISKALGKFLLGYLIISVNAISFLPNVNSCWREMLKKVQRVMIKIVTNNNINLFVLIFVLLLIPINSCNVRVCCFGLVFLIRWLFFEERKKKNVLSFKDWVLLVLLYNASKLVLALLVEAEKESAVWKAKKLLYSKYLRLSV